MTSTALRALSELTLWLRLGDTAGGEPSYRRQVLARLNLHVPFQRAIWADAVIGDRMTLRTPELYGIAPDHRAAFEAAAFADPRLAAVLGRPGLALSYSVQPDDPPDYLAAVAAIGVGHFISIADFDSVLGLAGGLVLFAAPDRPAFTEADRAFVEAAFPHLRAGWVQRQVDQVLSATGALRSEPPWAAASQGLVLTAAAPEFVTMMRLEWPGWTGPRLPRALVTPEGALKLSHLGARIVVGSRMAVDTAVLWARERALADELTPRELMVARLCAEGLSHKEISAHLSIAPTTARNHIAAVHRRLNVKRNSEIAALLLPLGADPVSGLTPRRVAVSPRPAAPAGRP